MTTPEARKQLDGAIMARWWLGVPKRQIARELGIPYKRVARRVRANGQSESERAARAGCRLKWCRRLGGYLWVPLPPKW